MLQCPRHPSVHGRRILNAEVVTIGTELLLGEIVDTNAVHIARQLRTIGLDLHYMTTVGDNLERIARVIDIALNRVDVVITSGGLGPTVDDVTREGVAKATGRPLVFSPELFEQIRAFFDRIGRQMSENNRRQAYIPAGAIPVPNPVGSAPAFIVETERGVVISLPGVPREMKYLLETAVLPYLRDRFHLQAVIKTRLLRTVAAGESAIDAAIADLMELTNPTVGLAAHPGQTDIRITAKAPSEEEADALIAPVEAEIRRRLGNLVFGVDGKTLAGVIGEQMQHRNLRLAMVDTALHGTSAQELAMGGYANIIAEQKPFADTETAIAELGATGDTPEAQALSVAQRISGENTVGLSILSFPAPNGGATMAVVAEAHGNTSRVRVFQHAYTGETAVSWLTTHSLNQLRRWLDGESVAQSAI